MNPDMYKKLEDTIKSRKDIFLLTITDHSDSGLIGSKALVHTDGKLYTNYLLPANLKQKLMENCEKFIRKKHSGSVRFFSNNTPVECFAEYFPAPLHLIVAGAGHVCEPMAEMGKMLGFYVTVIDDRPEFANRIRFPEADEVVCESYINYFKNVDITEKTYILLLTRGHKFDVLSLTELLNRNEQPAYIGMIGSRRRISGVFEEIRQEYPNESFDHLYTPVGLDIGAETPAEIAVSVMAEILKVKNQKSGSSLSEKIKKHAKKGFHEGAGTWNKCTS
jgi:xanthine dehydrogenase accessory factor